MSHADERFIEPWISEKGWNAKDFKGLETPCYVISQKHLEKNLKILAQVEKKAGVKVLAALKAFSMWPYFPLIKKYLSGTECSSVNEARLGATYFGKETHIFSPAYTEENMRQYLEYANHISFNSFSQWNRFKKWF